MKRKIHMNGDFLINKIDYPSHSSFIAEKVSFITLVNYHSRELRKLKKALSWRSKEADNQEEQTQYEILRY